MNHNKLRERILRDLKESNQSIRNVEKLAGLGRGSLYNFLDGHTKSPTLETLYALSEVLKPDLSELLGIVSDKEAENNQQTANLELFISVVEHIKQFLLNYKLSVTNKKLLELLKEIYYFSLSRKAGVLDVEFANWYLETEFEKKKPFLGANKN